MNTQQASEYTGIPFGVLVRMRARETTTRKSGPPYCKTFTKTGETHFVYSKMEIKKWFKVRRSLNCLITAGDAALILDVHREDIMAISGVRSFTLKRKGRRGLLVIDNSRGIYVWKPKLKR